MRRNGLHLVVISLMGRVAVLSAVISWALAARPAAASTWTVEGTLPDTGFGMWISGAGDVNGDGFADILIAAPNAKQDQGEVFLYAGSAKGLSDVPVWTASGESPGAWFGNVCTGVGDINGDGFSDVMLGSPFQPNGFIKRAGCAYLFLGSAHGLSSKPDWIYRGQTELGESGGNVQPAGDVNGDGFADAVVSAFHLSKAGVQIGRAGVFYGSRSGFGREPNWIKEGDQPSANFAQSATSAGDVNHDGYDDLIVGVQHYDGRTEDEGKAFLYLGSAHGLSSVPAWTGGFDSSYPRTIGGPHKQHYANNVSAAGDVNGDGFADVLITAYFAEKDDSDEGLAFLYLGCPTGLSSNAIWIGEGNQELATYGSSGTGIGDVNGDGFADIAIGAALADHGEVNEGGAFVYYGSTKGPGSEPNWSYECNQPQARLGRNVARAGDVNHDGYDDFLVGASEFSRGGKRVGKVWLHYGGPQGFVGSSHWSLRKSWWTHGATAVNNFLVQRGWMVALVLASIVGLGYWKLRRTQADSEQAASAHRQRLIEERHRLARDLHDDLGSRLTRLAVLSDLIGQDKNEASASLLAQSTRDVMTEMQQLVWAVNPRNDTLEGLADYLSSHLQHFFSGTGIRAIGEIPIDLPSEPLAGTVRKQLVLCVKEVLANVIKHAGATEVALRLTYEAPLLTIEVVDNGRGFIQPGDELGMTTAMPGGGNGLCNMSDRMKSVGGSFRFETVPGRGTTCVFQVTLQGL